MCHLTMSPWQVVGHSDFARVRVPQIRGLALHSCLALYEFPELFFVQTVAT